MDDIAIKVLISTKAFLERLIKANALEAHQLTEAHMAVTALAYQIARAQYDQGILAQVREAESRLAGKLSQLLHKAGSQREVVRKWHARWHACVGAALTAVLEPESGGSKVETRIESEVAKDLREFLVSYHQPLDPAISGGAYVTYSGGRSDRREDDDEPVYLTAPALQEYLRGRYPEHRSTTVTEVNRLMGGYSKETYIVKLSSATAGGSTIVIRKDGFGLPTGSSVVNEFSVIQEAYAAGVVAPEPLWLEADPKYFGAAFIAVGFAAGKPANLNVPPDAPTRRKWSDSIARTVAKLHRSSSKPGLDVREVMRGDITDLQRRVEDRERSPHPAIAFGLSWLLNHLDDLKGRPACRVHGDIGFHNMLMRDDELLVLLDWEFSHFSDPVEDLMYVKPFIDQIDSWGSFLEVYGAESGFRFDDTAARYFSVWKETRNAIACIGSLNSLLIPQVKDLPLSVAGNVYIPKYEISILDAILEGAKANV